MKGLGVKGWVWVGFGETVDHRNICQGSAPDRCFCAMVGNAFFGFSASRENGGARQPWDLRGLGALDLNLRHHEWGLASACRQDANLLSFAQFDELRISVGQAISLTGARPYITRSRQF